MDIINEPADGAILVPSAILEPGAADERGIDRALSLLAQARKPVVLLGLLASRPENSLAVRAFLDRAGCR